MTIGDSIVTASLTTIRMYMFGAGEVNATYLGGCLLPCSVVGFALALHFTVKKITLYRIEFALLVFPWIRF